MLINLAYIFLWVANIIFFVSILPQIFLNYKIKSTKGLSDFFILLCFCSSLSYWCYAFANDLPIVYIIMANLNLAAFLFLIFQKFYYSGLSRALSFYAIFLLIFIVILFLSLKTKTNLSFWGYLPIVISFGKNFLKY